MQSDKNICLLNDSFPPVIDGVANAVMNYAGNLPQFGFAPTVITPNHPEADDSAFPYDIMRYPSLDLRSKTGYMAGIPFSPEIVAQLLNRKISLLHCHCPIVSTMLARELRQIVDAPLVLTYHTKFDIDIANIMKTKAMQAGSKLALVENINACDEVWAVSQGAADNLHSLGYEGDCIVMHNGVDLPRERVSMEKIYAVCAEYDLPDELPVFMFVGRIMWYKGIRIILDALATLKAANKDFRMVFIGGGGDYEAVTEYVRELGLTDKCFFTGPVHDREALRAWYCRSDLFLFPSTFDTNGLVVREAAACSLASVLIRGSCAAEGITDGVNGFLIEENSESLFSCLAKLSEQKSVMSQVGENAARDLYISWNEAVKNAAERYSVVIDRYQSGLYPSRRKHLENVFRVNGELMEGLAKVQAHRQEFREQVSDLLAEQREHIRDILG